MQFCYKHAKCSISLGTQPRFLGVEDVSSGTQPRFLGGGGHQLGDANTVFRGGGLQLRDATTVFRGGGHAHKNIKETSVYWKTEICYDLKTN